MTNMAMIIVKIIATLLLKKSPEQGSLHTGIGFGSGRVASRPEVVSPRCCRLGATSRE